MRSHARYHLVLIAVALLVLAGCRGAPQAPRPDGVESAASPSAVYLATDPPSGWIRAIGRDAGFVLVFETPARFDASGAWEYRLVLFNESGSDVTWSGLALGVQGVAEGAPWEGFSMGLGGVRQTAPTPPVVLRSGESTTSESTQILQEPPLTYQVVGVVQASSEDTWFRSQTATVTVVSE